MSLIHARNALVALSVGDATGENLMKILPPREGVVYRAGNVAEHRLPSILWPWTDDTHMAIGVYRTLRQYGEINQRELAREFAKNYKDDIQRGYGNGTARLLFAYLYDGDNWKEQSENWWGPKTGSKGNGSAMRDSIIGSFFGPNLDAVARNARASAEVTHFHQDAIAGSIAVAIAAADANFYWHSILDAVSTYAPGEMLDSLKAVSNEGQSTTFHVASRYGNGSDVTALDTVPFALWMAHQALVKKLTFEQTMNEIIEMGGDTDTVAAMVGGIIGNTIFPSQEMIDRTEPLPADI